MDGGKVMPANQGGVGIIGKTKMDENSVMHDMGLRYGILVICSDYVVKKTNINNMQINRH